MTFIETQDHSNPDLGIPGRGAAPPQAEGTPSPITPHYDPTSATPYTAPAPPELPQLAPPPERQIDPGYQGSTVFGGGTKGTIGAIATIGASLLRGAQEGRERRKKEDADKADKLMKGLQFAYKNSSDQYIALIQSGKDPNSKEAKEAEAAADASWHSMMTMYGNNLMGGQKGKGKKKGSGGQDAAENPAQLISSQDPNDKLKGWYMLTAKAGAPYKYQAQAIRSQMDAASKSPENQLRVLQGQYSQLNSIPEAQRTPGQRAQLEDVGKRIQSAKEMMASAAHPPSAGSDFHRYLTTYASGIGKSVEQLSADETEEARKKWSGSGKTAPKPKVGWSKDASGKIFSAQLDAKNQFVKGTENYSQVPPSGMLEHVRSGEFTYKDDATGETYRVPYTTTTSPVLPGGGGGAGSGSGGGSSEHKTPAHTPAAHTPAHTPTPTPARAAATPAEADAAASELTHAGPPGARLIGKGLSRDEVNAHRQLIVDASRARTLTALLDTNDSYMKKIQSDPSAATPRQDLGMIVAAVRSMNPGTVRLPQKELEMEVKAGSYGDRFRRQYETAVSGLLPSDQREDLYHIIKNETTQFGSRLAQDWQENIHSMPVPNHLRRFLPKDAKTAAAANAPSGATDVVYAKDGTTVIGHVVKGEYVPLPKKE